MERLMKPEGPLTRLLEQYRMHPDMTYTVSKHFQLDQLLNSLIVNDRLENQPKINYAYRTETRSRHRKTLERSPLMCFDTESVRGDPSEYGLEHDSLKWFFWIMLLGIPISYTRHAVRSSVRGRSKVETITWVWGIFNNAMSDFVIDDWRWCLRWWSSNRCAEKLHNSVISLTCIVTSKMNEGLRR